MTIIYICMTIVYIYIYIYSVHSFHLLFFTTSISLLHFMMAALKSSNNSNISVISMLVSIDYPQGLPYSWFDDWFSTETWTFWGMTLGDSGPYFNLWLDLVSSDRGLAVSGSKRSLSFRMLSNSSSKTHSWVSNKTSGYRRSAELLSAGDTALFRLLLSLSRPSDGGVTAHCSETPSDLGYLEECSHGQGVPPIAFRLPLPTPKLTSRKGQPALQKDSKPTGNISILFLNCILFFSLFLFIWGKQGFPAGASCKEPISQGR